MKMDPVKYQALCRTAGFATRTERNNSEEGLHRTCIEWVNRHESSHPLLEWLIHVPNGGKHSKDEAGRFSAIGTRPRVPDLMLPFASPQGRYAGLVIELEAPNRHPTDEQSRWLKNCKAAGYLVAVCRTFEEFETSAIRFLSA